MAKHIVKGKVGTRDHKIFIVQKAAAGEQNVLLHFGRRVSYQVVKLSIKGLPSRTRDGKKIHWINNIGITDSRGKYVPRVRYTVFLRAPKRKATFVYHDRRGLHWDKTPRYTGSKPPRSGMLQVDFNTGDPAHGWT